MDDECLGFVCRLYFCWGYKKIFFEVGVFLFGEVISLFYENNNFLIFNKKYW